MRLLVITNQFPLPLDMGGPVRILGLMRALAASHDVHVLALRRPATTDERVDELARLLDAPVEAFTAPPLPRGRAQAARHWGEALRRGMPPWVLEERSPELGRRAAALAADADAVVLLDDYAGAYAELFAGAAPIVADKHNVAGWSAASNGALDALPARVAAARRALAIQLTRRFERRVAGLVQATVVTSDEERDRFRTLYGHDPQAVVPSAVALPPPVRAGADRGRRVGWLGSHDYDPNVDGLVRFVDEAWDALGEDGFELLVAGPNPTARVRALERHAGVRVLGYVERLGDFLDELGLAVVPLWAGAGVKVKTLTLMGAGIPVVATPVALEGVGAEHGSDCLIAEEPDSLAAGLRAIASDGDLAGRLAASGRRLVEERFTWASVGPRFVDVVEAAALSRR